jgi:tryptophan-rich sensory protein
MAHDDPRKLGQLSKLILVLTVGLVVAGVVWHGLTVATLQRLWYQELARPTGPMKFRFILQPLMAAIFAIRDGRKDARTGRYPYFWALFNRPLNRVERLEEGLNATARIILLGLVMDVIYQVIVLQRFYPAEAVIIAVLLAFVPYVLIRGPVARIARRWHGAEGHRA